MPILEKLVELKPDLVLFAGDNVYGDRVGTNKLRNSLDGLYHAYGTAQYGDKSAPFRTLKKWL